MSLNSRDEFELQTLAESQGHQLKTRVAAFLERRTPRDLQIMLPRLRDVLKGRADTFPDLLMVLRLLAREKAETFQQHNLSPEVAFYHDDRRPRRDKSLIMTFAGVGGRLMVPKSLLLQHIPASQFDIVSLKDGHSASYEQGVVGFDGPLPALVHTVMKAVRAKEYRQVYSFGVSMAGFPALRAGRIAGAKRAVSIGGSFAWPINQMREKPETFFQGYDVLCPCASPAKTELINAFGADYEPDAKSATLLEKRIGVQLIRENTDRHNLIFHLLQEHRLGPFLARLLDFDVNLLHRPREDRPQRDDAAARRPPPGRSGAEMR